LTDHVQNCGDGDAIGQSLGVGRLNGGAISDGICEGNAQFDDIC
jgi:hypothetical protein